MVRRVLEQELIAKDEKCSAPTGDQTNNQRRCEDEKEIFEMLSSTDIG